MKKLFVLWFAAARLAAAQTVDTQFWTDFVPQWKVGAKSTNETELSFRTAWTGQAATSYWITNTFEYNVTPWLGLDAIGAVVESRGPSHGTGYFEARPSMGVRFTWRGTRVRASEFVRLEHRMLRPLDGASYAIERFRHREQVNVAINHASLAADRTLYLVADGEWFLVHDGRGGWDTNQIRLRAGLGWRANAHRSFEAILNDTRRRANFDASVEDGDHVLRVRWREYF